MSKTEEDVAVNRTSATIDSFKELLSTKTLLTQASLLEYSNFRLDYYDRLNDYGEEFLRVHNRLLILTAATRLRRLTELPKDLDEIDEDSIFYLIRHNPELFPDLELTDIREFTPETVYYSIISIELADEIAEESLKAKPDLELDLKDSVVETQKAVCNLARYQLLLNSISGEKSTTDLFKVLIPKCPSTNFRLYTGTIKQSLSTFDFFKALAADPESFKQKFLDIFPIDEIPNHHLVFNFLYELFINIMQARSNIDQIIRNDNKKWLKFRSEYLPPEIDKPMWRLKELPESRGGSAMPDTLRSAAPELRLFSRILPQLSPGPSDEPLSPRTEKVLRRLLL